MPGKSIEKWDEPLKYAQDAHKIFRNAESNRKGKDIKEANVLVEKAMKTLELRYDHISFSPCII